MGWAQACWNLFVSLRLCLFIGRVIVSLYLVVFENLISMCLWDYVILSGQYYGLISMVLYVWYDSYLKIVFTYLYFSLVCASMICCLSSLLAHDVWFLKYRGSYDPRCFVHVFKCKIELCTHIAGVHLYDRNLLICFICIHLEQTLVLSSNTKNGRFKELSSPKLVLCVW
jgi:hypothetical protein